MRDNFHLIYPSEMTGDSVALHNCLWKGGIGNEKNRSNY